MSKRPDFLVICVDQMQAASMTCAGHPDVKTPNLDKLAAAGTRFSRAYCENPVCTPSRLSIITGLSSRQHGVYCNGQFLPSDIPTVTSVLREAGYRTKACGKLHLQPWSLDWSRNSNPQRGWRRQVQDGLHSFEDQNMWNSGKITTIPPGYFGFESVDYVGGHIGYTFGDYKTWLREESPEWHRILSDPDWRKGERFQACYFHDNEAQTPGGIAASWRMNVPIELHHNTWIADRSIAYIDSLQEDEDFFLWCSFPDPHHPFAASKPYSEMYDPDTVTLPPNWENAFTANELPMRSHGIPLSQFNERGLREMLAQTYGMITQIDDNIGRLVQCLEDNGRLDDTVIVFMGDHGDYLGAHHLICKGVFPFEELIRVPYIWRAPAATPAQCCDVPVSLLDFAPTVLDYAGVPLDELKPRLDYGVNSEIPWFNGISLKQALGDGVDAPARPLMITKEESNVHNSQGGPEVRGRCLISGTKKTTIYARHADNCLYDLESDPYEQRNLWDDPSAATLQAELLKQFAEESIWTEFVGVGRTGGA